MAVQRADLLHAQKPAHDHELTVRKGQRTTSIKACMRRAALKSPDTVLLNLAKLLVSAPSLFSGLKATLKTFCTAHASTGRLLFRCNSFPPHLEPCCVVDSRLPDLPLPGFLGQAITNRAVSSYPHVAGDLCASSSIIGLALLFQS